MIIPACFAYGLDVGSGPSLLFVTLPHIYLKMGSIFRPIPRQITQRRASMAFRFSLGKRWHGWMSGNGTAAFRAGPWARLWTCWNFLQGIWGGTWRRAMSAPFCPAWPFLRSGSGPAQNATLRNSATQHRMMAQGT